MPPRPEGTDGSDFSYREVVEDRYKRMAVNMSATLLMHQVQTLAVLLKFGWYLVPVLTEGLRIELYGPLLLGMNVLSNIFFYLGRPRGRCVLPFMKVAALLVLGTVGMHAISIWKYHMLDPATTHTPRRLYKLLKDEGKISSPKWLTAFTWFEALLDVFMMLGPGLCFYTFNEWVKDAMDAVKEREKRSKAAAAGAGVASSAKATARPSGGPRRRA